jgi:hypothetical protein
MNARQPFTTSRVEINLQSVIRISRDDEPPSCTASRLSSRWIGTTLWCLPAFPIGAVLRRLSRMEDGISPAPLLGWRRAATFLQGTFKKSPSIAFSASSRFN